jgi:hypothetical protein
MRGELKTHGRSIVLREYKVIPPNADELSEKEKRVAIRENIAPLLMKGTWAHAPAARVSKIYYSFPCFSHSKLDLGREKTNICSFSSKSTAFRLFLYWS